MASPADKNLIWNFTAKEYGLHYGLVSDHIKAFGAGRHLEELEGVRADMTQADKTDLPDFKIPSNFLKSDMNVDGDDALNPNDAARLLLETTLWHLGEQTVSELTDLVCMPRRVKGLKLVIPLLLSDNEADCRDFYEDIFESVSTRDDFRHQESVPLEPIDENKDEGLSFPPSAHGHASSWNRDIEVESLPDALLSTDDHAYPLTFSTLSREDRDVLLDQVLCRPLVRYDLALPSSWILNRLGTASTPKPSSRFS